MSRASLLKRGLLLEYTTLGWNVVGVMLVLLAAYAARSWSAWVEPAPQRWIVERTISWLSRNRRMSKEYERKVQMSETFIELAMIRLQVARLGRPR